MVTIIGPQKYIIPASVPHKFDCFAVVSEQAGGGIGTGSGGRPH